MGQPQNQIQVQTFLRADTFYQLLWLRRSHVLAPLHELTRTGAFVWTERHTKSFNEMKAILAADAMNTYPDLNLPFDVYTDSSDYQLRAAILQNC